MQKTAYEMRISDWSSDVCSSDLIEIADRIGRVEREAATPRDHAGDIVKRVVMAGNLRRGAQPDARADRERQKAEPVLVGEPRQQRIGRQIGRGACRGSEWQDE